MLNDYGLQVRNGMRLRSKREASSLMLLRNLPAIASRS